MKFIKTFELFAPSNLMGETNFPCSYYFMTKELLERLRKDHEHIGIVNHGYGISCETPEELKKAKEDYAVGKEYNGETITAYTVSRDNPWGSRQF